MTLDLINKFPCCNKEKCFKDINDLISKLRFRKLLVNVDEACTERMNAHGFKNEFECSDTVRLFLENIPDELLNSKVGMRYEYLLTDSVNNHFEVTIDKINALDKYIQLKKYNYDIAPLKLGKIDLTCILDYDKLPDMDKLKQAGFDTFPSFHETHFEVIKKERDYLHLIFSGGFHPLITDIKMVGVFKEEINMVNSVDPYDYFTKGGCVGDVQFQTIDDYFIIKISDNYVSNELIGCSEEISFEEILELQANPNNNKTEEHINEYTIYCSNISFEFKKSTT